MEHEELQERWQRGEAVPGVAFMRGAHVRVFEGPFTDDCAFVRDLLALDPEPRYRVDVDGAHVQLELSESALGIL
jgi:hypothetical protein